MPILGVTQRTRRSNSHWNLVLIPSVVVVVVGGGGGVKACGGGVKVSLET